MRIERKREREWIVLIIYVIEGGGKIPTKVVIKI